MDKIVAEVVWPLVGLLLGSFALVLFRSPIAKLIDRVKSVSVGKGAVEFGGATIDRSESQPRLESKPKELGRPDAPEVKWQNSGNLFWLGHDLMWTQQVGLRGAAPGNILHGLKQSEYHMRSLNLTNTVGGQRLTELYGRAVATPALDWNMNRRNQLATEISGILTEFGYLAERNQPDFQQDQPKASKAADRLGR